ncbi:MAG: hypothetical protein U9R49_15250, partial [Bacteroidota bacterium]|nr:hypothetical protein [Bacteroidota bacterium]
MKLFRTLVIACILTLIPRTALKAQANLMDLYYSGNYQEVIAGSGNLIASGDTAFNTFYLKALSEAQLELVPQAIETLKSALLLYPGDQRLSRMLSGQYYDAGDYVQARKGFQELVAWDSTDVSSWLKLAEMASFRQQFDEAIEALNQVLVIDSMNLGSLMMMGDILNRHNNSGAVIYYERAYRLYPENQKAAYALGNWYIQSKEAWRTIPICQDMLAL